MCATCLFLNLSLSFELEWLLVLASDSYSLTGWTAPSAPQPDCPWRWWEA